MSREDSRNNVVTKGLWNYVTTPVYIYKLYIYIATRENSSNSIRSWY